MNVIRQEIRTGLLVVFSLAVLVIVVLYLGAPGVFVPQKTFYIYVVNAGGLKQGAEVALGGRKVGQVVQLFSPVSKGERPDPKFETLIEIRVNRSAKIYNSVRVQVTSNGLLGEMFIDFTAGDEESGLAQHKHSFMGTKAPTLGDVAPQVLEKLDPIIKQANMTLTTLQGTATNINRLTAPEGELPSAINQFRRVGANLEMETGPAGPLHSTLTNISKMTAEDGKISQTLDNIRTLTGSESDLAKAMEHAEKFTEELQRNRDLPAALANSRRASEELNTALTELRFRFSTIAVNLEQATDTVKHQPWRLIWPSTKKYNEPARPVARRAQTNALGGTPVRRAVAP